MTQRHDFGLNRRARFRRSDVFSRGNYTLVKEALGQSRKERFC